MNWIILFVSFSGFAAVPTLRGKKVILPNGDFKLDSPVIEVDGKILPVGYRENFNGACKKMGGKYTLDVENQRVQRDELANVDANGDLQSTSKRIMVTKSITCKI